MEIGSGALSDSKKVIKMHDRTDLPFHYCVSLLNKSNWNVEEAIKLAHKEHLENSPFILR